ncbi:MAG: L-threonylcarbamoyladenylate synthase [Oscillospiraceae bacterium]|nr:L-threonylcarbamoyladenylate synthase [Oscillospiraceae bacterium]
METIRLTTKESDLERAGEIIRAGGLVAFPTETVYGLGANALDAEAVASVYRAKGRPSDNPMIVHIADTADLYALINGGITGLSDDASKLMMKLWPGPLTLIFRKSDIVPDVTTGGLDTVAIRMPSNPTARRLIKLTGRPVAAPSANLSGRPSPTTAGDVLEDMDGRIDAVVMGEQCDVGIESTVVDLTGSIPYILRPGAVTKENLESILKRAVLYDSSLLDKPSVEASPDDGVADTGFRPKSPGMKYIHYSPKATVRLIEGDDNEFREKAKMLGLEARERGEKTAILDYGNDPGKAAHRLFAELRELDRQGYDLVLIRTLDEEGFGFSVMNRMLKSAGYDVVK